MTKEEAIKCIRNLLRGREDKRGKTEIDIALEMAIKALDQGSVLDKIRVEIVKQEKWLMYAGYNVYNVDIAFDAIKSVVAESEEL